MFCDGKMFMWFGLLCWLALAEYAEGLALPGKNALHRKPFMYLVSPSKNPDSGDFCVQDSVGQYLTQPNLSLFLREP